MAPWLNLVLLIVFFLMLESRLVIQPGYVVELPQAPLTGGLQSGMRVVVMSVEGIGKSREEIVFFDDERFLVREEEQMSKLLLRLASWAASHREDGLIILGDVHARHGTVARIFGMAQDSGIARVDVAVRPSAETDNQNDK